jgi:hypothetical protein
MWTCDDGTSSVSDVTESKMFLFLVIIVKMGLMQQPERLLVNLIGSSTFLWQNNET